MIAFRVIAVLVAGIGVAALPIAIGGDLDAPSQVAGLVISFGWMTIYLWRGMR